MPNQEDVFLSTTGLTVRFGGVTALSDVSLKVRDRELVAIVGPNGAGKSTFLNAISGLTGGQPEGQIVLGGIPILGRSPEAIAQLGVGRSFQDPPLIDTESALSNVMTGLHRKLDYGLYAQICRPRVVHRSEARAREEAEAMLRRVGLWPLRNRPVGALPYGVRKLIDMARALVAKPDLLLLDEPTSGLDIGEQDAVAHTLRDLHRGGDITVIVVEHHADIVRAVADRVVALESGVVVAEGTPAEVMAMGHLEAIWAEGFASYPRTEKGLASRSSATTPNKGLMR